MAGRLGLSRPSTSIAYSLEAEHYLYAFNVLASPIDFSMTPPIPRGAPRQRGDRACIPCRTAKCKCTIDPDSDSSTSSSEHSKPCIRCCKLEIECEYAPNRRLGRPRRLPLPRSTRNPRPSTPDSDYCRLTLTPTNSDCYFTAILNEYKRNVHIYIPILPSIERDLEHVLRSAPATLLSAILNITFPNESDEIPMPTINPVLSDVQAAALLTLVYYGRKEKDNARSVLEMATNCLVNSFPYQLGFKGLGVPISSDSSTAMNTQISESWERVWWECWGLEILLSTITGVHSLLLDNFVPFQSLCTLDRSNQGQYDRLYLQSMALLRECIRLPPDPNAIDMERLESVSLIGSNIFSLARQQWLSTFSTCDSSSGLTIATKRERAFMTAIRAGVSTIHLHTASFASCLFQCGVDICSSPPVSSLARIRSASRSIFDLLRDALNRESPQLSSPSVLKDDQKIHSLPQHAPFFACAQYVAAQGSLLVSSSLQLPELSQTAMATDFQLAEWVIRNQNCKWPISRAIADEMHGLVMKIHSNISCPNTRQIIASPLI